MQAADHDFSSITLTPTVVLMNEIPERDGNSWYRGKTYVFIKIATTEPSSAMRTAAELKETFLKKYGTVELIPPITILYTDSGLERKLFVCQNCDHCVVSFT